MKISSASKKVLASALSAAMVVAFAPTVAFGANGDPVKISFDLQGGTAVTSTEFPYAVQGTTITMPKVDKAGYAATWVVENDGDGLFDDDIVAANGTYTIASDEVAFKAVYEAPGFYGAFPYYTPATDASGNPTHEIVFDTEKRDKTKAGVEYKLKIVSPNGVTLVNKTETVANNGDLLSLGETHVVIDKDFIVGGTYTATLTADGAELSKKEIKVVKLTYKDSPTAEGTTVYYDTAVSTQCDTVATALAGSSWLKDGYGFSASAASLADLRGDVTIVKAGAKDMTVGATGYTAKTHLLTYTLPTANLVKGDVYAYEIKDPSGAVIYSGSHTAEATENNYNNGKKLYVSFDQTSDFKRVNPGVTEAAGDYVLSVSVTAKDASEAKLSGKAKITLTEIVTKAGDNGKLADSFKGGDVFTSSVTQAEPVTVPVADKGYTFEGWDLNGNGKLNTTNNKNVIVAGKVNTFTATFKAIDKSRYVAEPTIASAVYDTTAKAWYLTFACETAGADINVVSGAVYDSTKKAYKATAATVVLQGKMVPGKTSPTLTHDSDQVTYTRTVDTWTDTVAGAAAVNKNCGLSTAKWSDDAAVKAAIEAGQAAVDAAGWKEQPEMGALLVSQIKAVYDAVAAHAAAELGQYADGALVVVGDSAYTMTAAKLEAANKKVAGVASDLAKISKPTAANYQLAIANVITNVNNALKNDVVKSKDYTKADIDAAAAVTAQLKDPATAEAGLAAYAALTDAQKKLVAGADVAAAQKVVDEAKAQAELKVAQDDAAVSKARNASKTVKAGKNGKTTKKQSVTLKKITSASGAKVTYKKSSGKKAITVKSGKAYLAKGVKKGTYKATVKATCGTQTAKITVKFVVK